MSNSGTGAFSHISVSVLKNTSFVYDLVKGCYASSIGRPSIDPVVFFKLQLIMFFEGIRSERQLMELVNLNLAYRWYIGYDLDEPVPDHSSLSKIRDRYGLVVFQRFFEGIIELCQAAGLGPGTLFRWHQNPCQCRPGGHSATMVLGSQAPSHRVICRGTPGIPYRNGSCSVCITSPGTSEAWARPVG